MSILEKSLEIIKGVGFEDVSEKAIAELRGKQTKVAERVLAAIDGAEYFEIYATDKRFTIVSPIKKTNNIVKQFTRLLKKEYVYLPNLLYDNDGYAELED